MQVLRVEHPHGAESLQPPCAPNLLILFLGGKGHHEGWYVRVQDVQGGVVPTLTDRSGCRPQPGSQMWDHSV